MGSSELSGTQQGSIDFVGLQGSHTNLTQEYYPIHRQIFEVRQVKKIQRRSTTPCVDKFWRERSWVQEAEWPKNVGENEQGRWGKKAEQWLCLWIPNLMSWGNIGIDSREAGSKFSINSLLSLIIQFLTSKHSCVGWFSLPFYTLSICRFPHSRLSMFNVQRLSTYEWAMPSFVS